MENTYGIGVTNRYSLFLDEEEDPLELLKLQELERETKRRSKILEKESKTKNTELKPKPAAPIRKAAKELVNAKVASTNKPTESTQCKDEIVHSKVASHRPKNVKFVGDAREDWNNRRNRDERSHQTTSDYIRDGPREGQSRPRRTDAITGTRDGPRESFGRGFRGNMTGGLREGRSHGPRSDFVGDDKRERGFGPRGSAARGQSYRGMSGNRGSYGIRLKKEFDRPFVNEVPHSTEAPSNEWEAESPAPTEVVAGDATVTPAVAEDVAENPPLAEIEPHELTLDEYKALRSSRQKPTYNLRKAGEGEDLTQWKNMYELSKKKEEDEANEEEAIEFDALEYPQRVGRQKHLLNIDIHFTDGRRGSRGGRGGSRGSRGSWPRGGGAVPRPDEAPRGTRDHHGPAFRGERGMRFMSERGVRAERGGHVETHGSRAAKQSAPKVDDEHDFPSLG